MSPKQQFLENKEDVRFLADLTADSRFKRCLNYALLQYFHRLTTQLNMDDGQIGMRLLGVQQFVQVLETLWQQAPEPKSANLDNLDHST